MYFCWVNNLWFHDEKKDRDKTICTKCPEWIRICCHGNNVMTGVCRIKDLHMYTHKLQIYMHVHVHMYTFTCMHAYIHTYTISIVIIIKRCTNDIVIHEFGRKF